MIQSDLAVSLVAGVFLLLLVLWTCWLWPRVQTAPATPKPSRPPYAPKPCAGCTRQPECPAWEQAAGVPPAAAPSAPPPRLLFSRGRHRHVETTRPCCPQTSCAYHGRVDWGHSRANGHPSGRQWRQLVCRGCRGSFLETQGTPLHGQQGEPDQLVWASAALAEGLGIRAVARVFETDPTTVVCGLVEAAAPLEAFAHHFVHAVDGEQGQRDELCALLSAVKDGEVSERRAITRLSRSPHGLWVAMDPVG
jgi:hypothetical protein